MNFSIFSVFGKNICYLNPKISNMEIKVKPVELIELFYDLIFVYAISKLTALISEPVNGVIAPYGFFTYIITSFVILQAWLYFTNYVNRYGEWEWYDYILVCVNMIAVIYMANTIYSFSIIYCPGKTGTLIKGSCRKFNFNPFNRLYNISGGLDIIKFQCKHSLCVADGCCCSIGWSISAVLYQGPI